MAVARLCWSVSAVWCVVECVGCVGCGAGGQGAPGELFSGGGHALVAHAPSRLQCDPTVGREVRQRHGARKGGRGGGRVPLRGRGVPWCADRQRGEGGSGGQAPSARAGEGECECAAATVTATATATASWWERRWPGAASACCESDSLSGRTSCAHVRPRASPTEGPPCAGPHSSH